MSKTVLKELMLYLPAKIIEGVIGIALVSLYTHHMAQATYGQYSLIITFTMTVFLPICGWLMHASYRHIIDYYAQGAEVKFNQTVWSLWLAMQLILLFVIALLSLVVASYRSWLMWVPLVFVPYSAVQVLNAQMAATKRRRLVIVLTTINIMIKFVITYVLLQWLDPLSAVLIGYASGDSISLLLAFGGAKTLNSLNRWHIDRLLAREFFSYGLPLIGLALTITITNFSDRFIIDWLFDKAAVGTYTANYTIASATFTFIMVGIMRAVHPNILRAWQDGARQIHIDIWQGMRLFFILAIPAAVGLAVLSRPLARLILAEGYDAGSAVIVWVTLGMATLGTAEYVIKPLELSKNTRPIFYSSLIAAVLNVVLNIWLVPRYGYTFASVTTFIAYSSYLLCLGIYVWHRYTLYVDVHSVIKILLSAGAMGLVVWLYRPAVTGWLELSIAIGLGIVSYGICMTLTGELSREWQLIKNRL